MGQQSRPADSETFAAETALDSGAEIDLTLEDGRLVITPVSELRYSLSDLLAGVTPQNLHSEIDTGSSQGAEVW